jgi:hypothetical protein
MKEGYVHTYNGEDHSARAQFQRLSEILTGEAFAPVHNAAPKKPRIGRIVVSDGVHWNPIAAGVPRLVWWNGTAWKALNA